MTDDNNQSSQGAQEEKVYYDEGNVKITNRRTILDDKTYVLKNISSVTVNLTLCPLAFNTLESVIIPRRSYIPVFLSKN